jgi:hypothetical protein
LGTCPRNRTASPNRAASALSSFLELAVADDREAVASGCTILESRQRLKEHLGRLLGIEAADREQLDRVSGARVVVPRR